MRSFREEYQKEMQEAGTFHLRADQVADELQHRRRNDSRRKRSLITAASAAAVFLLVGGVATAMNYGSSFIRVRDNGFSITSERDTFTEEEDMGNTPDLTGLLPEETAVEEMGIIEYEAEEYDSLEAFQKENEAIVPLPDLQLVGGTGTEQYVNVMNHYLYISLMDETGKNFSLIQMDHRGEEAYASATAYGGEAVNERNHTTGQGYTYKVIDIVEEGENCGIECAISLYGRDLLVGFRGYTQEEAYAVLESMDLGVYLIDE